MVTSHDNAKLGMSRLAWTEDVVLIILAHHFIRCFEIGQTT